MISKLKLRALLFVVLFSACRPAPAPLTTKADFMDVVNGYLVDHIGLASFGGQVFCSYEVLDAVQEDVNVDVYVWALCQEYYWDGNSLEIGTGSSLPVALHLQKTRAGYRLLKYEVPKDGMEYGLSIQRIFSPLAIQNMCEEDPNCYNGRAERQELENKQKAKEFYKIG